MEEFLKLFKEFWDYTVIFISNSNAKISVCTLPFLETFSNWSLSGFFNSFVLIFCSRFSISLNFFLKFLNLFAGSIVEVLIIICDWSLLFTVDSVDFLLIESFFEDDCCCCCCFFPLLVLMKPSLDCCGWVGEGVDLMVVCFGVS